MYLYGLLLAAGRSAQVHNRGNEALEAQYRHMRLKSASTILMYWMAVPLAYWSVRLALAVLILMPILYFLPERKLLEALEP